MKNRSIKFDVLRVLYSRSGNKCAFPGCCMPIFEDTTNQLTGECCHIEAFSEKGPRFNASLSDTERNGYNNLILLCSRHHKIIDGNPTKYTVEVLKEMKSKHENNYLSSTFTLNEFMFRQLCESSKYFWKNIGDIHEENPDLHRELDIELSLFELIDIVDENFSKIEELMEMFEMSDSCLMNDVQDILKKLSLDTNRINEIPYYENPFYNRNWELHNIGRLNLMQSSRMYYYALVVRCLEYIMKIDASKKQILKEWRDKLLLFQKNNLVFD